MAQNRGLCWRQKRENQEINYHCFVGWMRSIYLTSIYSIWCEASTLLNAFTNINSCNPHRGYEVTVKIGKEYPRRWTLNNREKNKYEKTGNGQRSRRKPGKLQLHKHKGKWVFPEIIMSQRCLKHRVFQKGRGNMGFNDNGIMSNLVKSFSVRGQQQVRWGRNRNRGYINRNLGCYFINLCWQVTEFEGKNFVKVIVLCG